MRITAIISEYNPFHNGHLYHISKAVKETKPDALVILLSGSVTQRGDFALAGKYTRAAWAIKAGADIVLELPACYAINSAEQFARGGVKMLSAFDNVTLSFGSECGDLDVLKATAESMRHESAEFKAILNEKLKEGCLYAKCRSEASNKIFPEFSEIIDKPNNILALEYIKAASGKNISLHTVKRQGNGYNDGELSNNFASATAVRNTIFTGNYNDILRFIPQYVAEDLKNSAVNADISQLLMYKLASLSAKQISALYDVGEGLENRIVKCAKEAESYNELIEKIKTKRYTLAKIKRVMLYALLDMDKAKMNRLLNAEPYYNVLALKDGRNDILSEISKHTNNLTVKSKDIEKLEGFTREMADLDKLAYEISKVLGVKDKERPF